MPIKHIEILLPDYASGRLEHQLIPGVESHLAECGRCRSELEAIRTTFQVLEDQSVNRPSTLYFTGLLPRIRERVEEKSSASVLSGPLVSRIALPLGAGALAVILLLQVRVGTEPNQSAENPLTPVLKGVMEAELVEAALDQQHRQIITSPLGETETSAMLAGPILRSGDFLTEEDIAGMTESPVLESTVTDELGQLSEADVNTLVARLSERNML